MRVTEQKPRPQTPREPRPLARNSSPWEQLHAGQEPEGQRESGLQTPLAEAAGLPQAAPPLLSLGEGGGPAPGTLGEAAARPAPDRSGLWSTRPPAPGGPDHSPLGQLTGQELGVLSSTPGRRSLRTRQRVAGDPSG